jgi:DNA-binding LacI/PurR family transcriptional regulator
MNPPTLGTAAAQHVIDLGHRQVALITTGFGSEP